MNKQVILRVQYFRKYLFKIATNLNLKPEPEICPPRSGGWRVSRRRGRVFSYWRVSRRRGRVFSYLAAYVLGLVLGLVCHIGDSSVAGNQLRSSRMLEFLAVLVQISDFRLGSKQSGARIWTQNHPQQQQWAHSRRFESEAA